MLVGKSALGQSRALCYCAHKSPDHVFIPVTSDDTKYWAAFVFIFN